MKKLLHSRNTGLIVVLITNKFVSKLDIMGIF